VKFFITGRPEPRIKTGFRLPLLVDSTDVFVLHDIDPSLVNSDIRLFLKHELFEVAQRYLLEGWPSDEHIDLLCRRAGGLFVYAVATVRFLDSSTHLPKRRLELIVNLPECTAPEGKTRFNSKTTLDLLYTSILKAAFSEEDSEVDSKVRSTIGTVVLLANPLPPCGIAELIGLDPDEVIQFLKLLQSLLVFNGDSSQPVKPFHKSFPDFITDPSRCTDTRFLVSPKILHLELAMSCLRVMNDGLERNLLSLPDYVLNSEVKDLETKIKDRISDALRYACRSWHSHLTKTEGNATGVISHLRVFLEEKFLAWLEVLSVLGAVRGAIVALEQLIPWLEVSRDKELLGTARDYSRFVATFSEPISVSATHIYHSALELSPLSSIVRRRYYRQRHRSLPRVVVGTEESWEDGIIIPSKNPHLSYTWSPCGQFIAARGPEAVEIRDSLSLEPLLTLPTTGQYKSQLAYSTDGRSIAFLSGTLLVIWDIQTGGVAKEIEILRDHAYYASPLWSLDGSTIGIVEEDRETHSTYVVRTYDVASGATDSPGALESTGFPQLWVHGTSFRVVTTGQDGQARTINIFEVGSLLTKIECFHIESWAASYAFGLFSHTTYRISGSLRNPHHLVIMDVRDSRCLLQEEGEFYPGCFSSDGGLFAASQRRFVHIWKYTSGRYVRWRRFTLQESTSFTLDAFRFSPTSSSLLGCINGISILWHLDGPPIGARPDGRGQLIVFSPHGDYIVAGRKGDSTATITNTLPQTLPFVIDTGMAIERFALTGNILLVQDSTTITAWRLTEEGMIDGAFADGRVCRGNRIWAISTPKLPGLYVGDQTVAIENWGNDIHVYHKETGEVLKHVPRILQYFPRLWGTPLNAMDSFRHHQWADQMDVLDHPHEHWWGTPSEGSGLVSQETLREGWVKGPGGKHLLWLPVEWRASRDIAKSLSSNSSWKLSESDSVFPSP
ncbi:hypothetical protein BDM02DRAFT_3192706, partial [Thelephora ganbajun]